MSDKILEQKIINEEHKIWKKNVPHLYDLLFSHALEWPSLSVQWFPDSVRDESLAKTTQRLLLSTHTSGEDREYVMIASVDFPDKVDEEQCSDVVADTKLKINIRIPVISVANKVRYNPTACNILAAKSDEADLHIYDYTRQSISNLSPNPDMTLTGHTQGGFGISWNSLNFGELVSAGLDGMVNVYDIGAENSTVSPKISYLSHTAPVNDVSYSYFYSNILASVGDDRKIMLWDTKSKSAIHTVEDAHTADIFAVHFSPLKECYLATGSCDKSIKIWDQRNLSMPAYTLLGHSKEVLTVQWSPHAESMLASSSADRRVCVWDLSKCGSVLTDDEALEGPPELLFLHGGHTNSVSDISWNPIEPMEIASVSEDNIVQVWQMPEDDY